MRHPVSRTGSAALGLVLVALVPAMAGAQNLQATPLQGLFAPLPALPAPVSRYAAAPEAPGAFMKGRFLIGVNISNPIPRNSAIDSGWKFSPAIRNTPRRTGWGPSFGLNWFRGGISVPVGGQRIAIGEVKVRPVMAGISYSFRTGHARTSLSFVGGYAFTSARVTAALPADTTATIDIRRSWVVRPNIGVIYPLTRRLALTGSAGYVFTKPIVTFSVTQLGQGQIRASGSLSSDYANLTVGLAFSIF
jgi:hypothetical protein